MAKKSHCDYFDRYDMIHLFGIHHCCITVSICWSNTSPSSDVNIVLGDLDDILFNCAVWFHFCILKLAN